MATAQGTYAGQPIEGRFIGGGILSLRDASDPYPIDFRLENGPTKVALSGTVDDPLAFKGTAVHLELSGPDMAKLMPLSGIPIPETPPYRIAGRLDYRDGKIRFEEFAGTLGHSDLRGTIAVDPGSRPPFLEADIASKLVDLDDLAGSIGSTPGDSTTKGRSAAQRREMAEERASPRMLPDTPVNVPKLESANVRLVYHATRIRGRNMPLDNLAVNLSIQDGSVAVKPISFGVGKGRIVGNNLSLTQQQHTLRTRAELDFQQVDVARLMAATGVFRGAGTIGGKAEIDATGRSFAQMLGNGNGGIKLFMTGGNLSAVLADLVGLQFGDAVLSALGIPNSAQVRCMILDMPLAKGLLSTRTLLIDTSENNILGSGNVNLRDETIDYRVEAEAKRFTIGSLPAPVHIGGTFKNPDILPDPGVLAARGGAAAALGVLLTPLAALIPTVQLGLGEDNNCGKLVSDAARSGRMPLSREELRDKTRR